MKFKRSFLKDPEKTMKIYENKMNGGKGRYIEKVQVEHPTFLHEMYHYAVSVLGASATTKAIVEIMKKRAKIIYPSCPTRGNLQLNTYHFWRFFHRNNGRLIAPTTKPRLNQEKKVERVQWAEDMLKKIEEGVCYNNVAGEFRYCFLDEKWFYTTSRRKRIKLLPKAEFESAEQAYVPMPHL